MFQLTPTNMAIVLGMAVAAALAITVVAAAVRTSMRPRPPRQLRPPPAEVPAGWKHAIGPLEKLLEDPSVTEIMVNRHDRVFVERAGKMTLTDLKFASDAQVVDVIRRIISNTSRHIDEKSPMVDARLADGSRINAVLTTLATSGTCMTIRKFARDAFTLDQLVEMGSMSREMADFLAGAVRGRQNVAVSGGSGTGKTSLLNVLCGLIGPDERVITIEDAAELRLAQPNVISLESRPMNLEGAGAIPIRQLVANALRMRPDRIVVGECRGGEALDMLQAMNTGHEGSMTSVHANSPRDAVSRLETLVHLAGVPLPSVAIRQQIAAAIHVIVQTARLADGRRVISQIALVSGQRDNEVQVDPLFVFEPSHTDEKGRVFGEFRAL